MWDKLGFKENPYSTKPLRVKREDVELLIGRDDSSIDLATALDSTNNAAIVLSGVPGVGKTSFLNVQQYLLENEALDYGPKIIASRQLCPVQTGDDPYKIAFRALSSLLHSVESYCIERKFKLPKNTEQIKKWLSQSSSGKGFEVGISILGFGGNFGRDVALPSVGEITYETLIDLITAIVNECIIEFEKNALVIVLDNVENLSEKILGETLMTFRDTLFSIENLHWIIIGQDGLGSLIQSLDSRVHQRLTTSIELNAITEDELKKAIDTRIKKFHKSSTGKSPISEKIYKKLYNCSNGEIRFVFKYCNEICITFAGEIRKALAKDDEEKDWHNAIGRYMTQNEFVDTLAEAYLSRIVKKEFDGLNLKPKDKDILLKIGQRQQTRPRDYKDFGIKTMQDFSSNYLNRFANQDLLLRRQEGRAVLYELRGLSLLANEYHLLKN